MSTKSDETRERILACTHTLLTERGAQETRLADVARAAGVSRQTVYLHFGSRAGLLVALVNHMDATSGLVDRLRALDDAPSGVEALVQAMGVAVAFAPGIHPVFVALDHVRADDAAAAAAIVDRMDSRRANFRDVLERVRADGRLAQGWSVAEAADAVWAISHPNTWQLLVEERGWTAERFLDFIVQAALGLVVD